MLERLLDQISGGGLPAVLASLLLALMIVLRHLRLRPPKPPALPPAPPPDRASHGDLAHRPDAHAALIVDDDSQIARVLARLLHHDIEGLDVLVAASGPEALVLARAQPFDLFIVDVSLAGMSGPELVRQLRDEGILRDAHVVIVSGFAGDELEAIAESCGASAWIAKPFEVEQLATIVRRLLRIRTT